MGESKLDLFTYAEHTELENCKSLLCVQAHPRELELAAGGTIAKLVKKGCKVFFLTITDGSKGTPDASLSPLRLMEIRRQEAVAAGKLLGVTEQLFFDYTDGDCPPTVELCRGILAVIRALRPQMVLSMDPYRPYEFHPDRLAVAMSAAQAVFLSAAPHYHKDVGEAHSVESIVFHTTNSANVFVNIEETLQQKLDAIFLHTSQTHGEEDLRFYIDYLSRMHARKCGCEHSEAFFQLPSQLMSLHFQD